MAGISRRDWLKLAASAVALEYATVGPVFDETSVLIKNTAFGWEKLQFPCV